MRKVIVWVFGAIAVAALVTVGYLYFAGGSGEPSTALTTPTIAADPTTTVEGDAQTTGSTTGEAEAGAVAFVIDPAQSTAAFEIDEVLRGEPKRVVGRTSEIAGQFQVDPDDLESIEFSPIVINARTFETDSGNRDRAIRGPVILDSASDEFEFINFEVSSVEGLSGGLSEGEPLTFTITGDLTIRDTAKPVTFDVAASMVGETAIEGTAEATVLRSDYGIGIPNAPGVADVSDEVLIRLEFVATS
jgi:polyisoprenoid-binding protein YceI